MPDFEASGATVVDLPRGPGRPKGLPKTGGRPKGARNRRTKEVEAVLRPLIPGAKKKIKALLGSEDEEIALKAVQMLFAYVFGKPVDRREISGPDGAPTYRGELLGTMESARQILFALRQGVAAKAELDEAEARTFNPEPEPIPAPEPEPETTTERPEPPGEPAEPPLPTRRPARSRKHCL